MRSDHNDENGQITERPRKTDMAGTAPPELAWLRRLVTALAAAMVVGCLAIAAILWTRLSALPLPQLPAAITLPDGAMPEAVTFARDWTVVVTQSGEVLLYDRAGKLANRVVPGQ